MTALTTIPIVPTTGGQGGNGPSAGYATGVAVGVVLAVVLVAVVVAIVMAAVCSTQQRRKRRHYCIVKWGICDGRYSSRGGGHH